MNGPRGMGDYERLAKPWGWMNYPAPYGFANPRNVVAPVEFYAPAASMGLGCAACGGTCGMGGDLPSVTPMQLAVGLAALAVAGYLFVGKK